MKKKYLIILPILLFIESLNVINFVNAFSYNLISFSTNQTEYYVNESIKINASWVLNYDSNSEDAYVQVHIVNNFSQFIWNSSEYYQIGAYEKNWTVNIKNFDLNIEKSYCVLYIKFFVFYFHIDTGSTMCNYPATIEISVMKNNVSCELVGYKDNIKLGENLNLMAKFYDDSASVTRYLINQTVQFMISFNDLIIQECNYTTNMLGIISIQLLSVKDLVLGQNLLTFSIENNDLYNDSKFIYEILVEKNVPLIDIVNFNDYLDEGKNLEMKLYCYYYLNQSEKPLANHSLLVKIFNNTTLTFINEYETDENGFLEVSISQDSFNYNQIFEDFKVIILLNRTYFLENITLTLNLNLNQNNYSKILNAIQLKIISFTSVLVIILILISYIIINRKNKNEKLLTELIIRY